MTGGRRPSRTVLVATVAAIAVAATTLTWWRLTGPWLAPPRAGLTWNVFTTLTYAVAGAVAWRRRPRSRVGPLLLTIAATYVLSIPVGMPPAWLTASASVFLEIPAVLLAALLLSFPEGRLRGTDRAIVVAGATLVVTAPLWNAPAAQLLASLLAAVVVGRTMWRWARATGPSRRVLAPIPFAALWGFLVAVSVGWLGLAGYVPGAAIDQRWIALNNVLAVTRPLVPLVILWGLLRVQQARGGVADLVVCLDEDPTPSGLQAALAKALRDPSLEVLYWSADLGTYVDVAGRERALPTEGRDVNVVTGDGAPLAALVYDGALREEQELVDAVVAAARLALVRARLQAEVQAQLQQVRASRARLVEATDAERRRLERDLHDGAQQRLVTLTMALKMAERRARATGDGELVSLLAEAHAELHDATEELRELARGIHPAILTEEGLGPALRALTERAAMPAYLTSSLDGRLPPAIEATAYFVVCEALANAAKHAKAATTQVRVLARADTLLVEVVDDGIGGAEFDAGGGLRGLHDRVVAVGGRLRVDSPRGGGTRVRAELPCA